MPMVSQVSKHDKIYSGENVYSECKWSLSTNWNIRVISRPRLAGHEGTVAGDNSIWISIGLDENATASH